MLRFPARLLLRIREDRTGAPIPGIAVTLVIKAQIRDDYHLSPALSDEDGEVLIDRAWAMAAVEFLQNRYAMDFATPFDKCKPLVELIVMSAEEIVNAIDAMKEYHIEKGAPDVSRTLTDLLGASNKSYRPRRIEILLDDDAQATKQYELRLERKIPTKLD